MNLRQDALAGAAELVLAVDGVARRSDGVLATVGAIQTGPNVLNAVPGCVIVSIEIRAPHDGSRTAARARIETMAQKIATDRDLGRDMRHTYAQPATPCDMAISLSVRDAVRANGHTGATLASGATRDTSAMVGLCPPSA